MVEVGLLSKMQIQRGSLEDVRVVNEQLLCQAASQMRFVNPHGFQRWTSRSGTWREAWLPWWWPAGPLRWRWVPPISRLWSSREGTACIRPKLRYKLLQESLSSLHLCAHLSVDHDKDCRQSEWNGSLYILALRSTKAPHRVPAPEYQVHL